MSRMPDERIITTARELSRIAGRMNEAVDKTPSSLDGLTDVEKAQFLAQLPRAIEEIRKKEASSAVMSTPQHQFASLLQSMVAANATSTEVLSTGELEAQFDTNDWFGWAKTLWHMMKDARNKFPWQDPPPQPEKISQFEKSPTIAVFSDWGTGLYGAPEIANRIREDKDKIDIVLHLGDVYYSGTDGEFQDRFSKLWPDRANSLHRTLNGNHEMYSGGRPYWNVIQQKPFEQQSSCFAYENDFWIVIGLDTAYQDHDLYQDQEKGHDEVAWLNRVVDGAEGRGVVLFSHHQPFSLLDAQGPNLRAKIEDHLLKTGKVFAWYWGHEHECVIYDRHPDWRMYGRCVGHAGMPEFRKLNLDPVDKPQFRRIPGTDNAPSALVLDGPNQYIRGEETDFIPHGFMKLRFEKDSLIETYLSPDGSQLLDSIELKR